MLTLGAVLSIFVGDWPTICVDQQVTSLGFNDYTTGAFTPDQSYVCGLGLGFIPTPFTPIDKLESMCMEDARVFTRKVLLRDYWKDSDQPMPDSFEGDDGPRPLKFSLSSSEWMPPAEWSPSEGVLESLKAFSSTFGMYERA